MFAYVEIDTLKICRILSRTAEEFIKNIENAPPPTEPHLKNIQKFMNELKQYLTDKYVCILFDFDISSGNTIKAIRDIDGNISITLVPLIE